MEEKTAAAQTTRANTTGSTQIQALHKYKDNTNDDSTGEEKTEEKERGKHEYGDHEGLWRGGDEHQAPT